MRCSASVITYCLVSRERHPQWFAFSKIKGWMYVLRMPLAAGSIQRMRSSTP